MPVNASETPVTPAIIVRVCQLVGNLATHFEALVGLLTRRLQVYENIERKKKEQRSSEQQLVLLASNKPQAAHKKNSSRRPAKRARFLAGQLSDALATQQRHTTRQRECTRNTIVCKPIGQARDARHTMLTQGSKEEIERQAPNAVAANVARKQQINQSLTATIPPATKKKKKK